MYNIVVCVGIFVEAFSFNNKIPTDSGVLS